MLSMTGFGKGSAVFDGRQRFIAEVSSVNRKQLEARISLPSEFSGFEVNARKLIGEYVSRGSVQLRVSFDGGGAAEEVTIDRGLLASLVKVCLEVRHDIGLDGNVAVEELMRVPGVVGGSTPDMDRPGLAAAFEQAVREALTHHREMREREGEALKKDFQERLATLEGLLKKIDPLVGNIADSIKQRLMEKLAAENIPVGADDDRLLKEVLFYADKSDVTEEITRLHSHFAQFRRFLEETQPVGRNMDFLMQEFFREITTLGNKAGVPAVSPLVVAFKSELEKLREQIQNVE